MDNRKELCTRRELYDEHIPDSMDSVEFICKGHNSFRSEKSVLILFMKERYLINWEL